MFADQFTSISAAPVGRWMDSLKPDEVATLELLAGPVMEKFNYAPHSNLAVLGHPERMLILRRLMSLARVSNTAYDRTVIQSALDKLNNPTAIEISHPSAAVTPPAWQIFSRLAWLYLKESLRK